MEANIKCTIQLKEIMLSHFMAATDCIKVSYTLDDLRKPLSTKARKTLEEKAMKMQEDTFPTCCTSAVYIGMDGNPLAFYLGRCLVDKEKKGSDYVSQCFCFCF